MRVIQTFLMFTLKKKRDRPDVLITSFLHLNQNLTVQHVSNINLTHGMMRLCVFLLCLRHLACVSPLTAYFNFRFHEMYSWKNRYTDLPCSSND